MIDSIIAYIGAHWVQWLFAAISALLANGYRKVSNQLNEEREKNEAIAQGMQALLRNSIVSDYNKWSDRGYCPIYAKENLRSVYESYHRLGGNDIATKLYRTLLDMPEEDKTHES